MAILAEFEPSFEDYTNLSREEAKRTSWYGASGILKYTASAAAPMIAVEAVLRLMGSPDYLFFDASQGSFTGAVNIAIISLVAGIAVYSIYPPLACRWIFKRITWAKLRTTYVLDETGIEFKSSISSGKVV